MRFHVLALPHTQVTPDFAGCAFTEKVRRFCIMMTDLGHEVFLYAGEETTAPVTELITCITEAERQEAVGDQHYTTTTWDQDSPHWQVFNANIIRELGQRLQSKDFICAIGGYSHKPIADAFPSHMTVEFGVGYGGVFSNFRVFESYAWMHSIYAAYANPTTIDGKFFDVVIPGYFEPDWFPLGDGSGDYYLYIGRIIDRKGYAIAQEVCELLGKRLILAGPGEGTGYGEFIGSVNPEQRAELMGKAVATFAPTLYIEPFGNVAIESQACGTPTITTDWGAFTETNPNGVTGFRCRTLQEFCDAAEKVKTLDRKSISEYSKSRYSLDVIGRQYETYFTRLLTLWDGGWYQLRS